ncbi:PLP-dependent aminotransferase family protein [Exilibacterium tricleocarpae]|uniref:PLP-dependent aminotransferase family protein n=1 Tax=Exilibacterium tricleocarpae TaxID=2591008 RepID=A0A545TVN2_9GAMM|nr:PLP-dependent aminotransferase family protein [Exilibacterium tricleocarpae]TQV81262.1 PLP-dependent aminotransferase family protein [Exilibacterium tricleocarpae]
MPLYQHLADRLARQIATGTYQPGQRLPSLRHMARRMEVSLSTVVAAYGLLEQRNLVAARHKSGFYVVAPGGPKLPPPAKAPGSSPARLHLSASVAAIFDTVSDPAFTPFAVALPAADYLPAAALGRAANAVRRQQFARSLELSTAPGLFELRQQIAIRMLGAGCLQAPEDIVITSGCQEAVALSLRALTSPGDVVAVESPCYYGFLLALESLHLRVVTIATDAVTGLDLDALEQAARRWPLKACICSPSFSNPTGGSMDAAARARLLQLAEHYDFHIIEDDILGELGHEGPRPPALKAFDSNERVLYCASFTKSLAPGIRVGWVAAGTRCNRIRELSMAGTTGAGGFSQLLLLTYLRSGHFDKHLHRVRAAYRHNLDVALATIGRSFPTGTRATRARGGFLIWVELPPPLNAHTLYEYALREKISIMPGRVFGRSGFEHGFRLSCALPWTASVNTALERLGGLAKGLEKG